MSCDNKSRGTATSHLRDSSLTKIGPEPHDQPHTYRGPSMKFTAKTVPVQEDKNYWVETQLKLPYVTETVVRSEQEM